MIKTYIRKGKKLHLLCLACGKSLERDAGIMITGNTSWNPVLPLCENCMVKAINLLQNATLLEKYDVIIEDMKNESTTISNGVSK